MADVQIRRSLSSAAGQASSDDIIRHLLSLQMRIRNSPRPTSDAPIIIYLACGLRPEEHHRPIHNPLNSLALSAQATVVEICYRLSPKSPFPKPIHDVMAGYDWIRKYLYPSPKKRDIGSHPNTSYALPSLQPKKRIGVCGELAGGSLAAMLALTECNLNGITTAALGNPIVDWSSPLGPHIPSDSDNLNRSIKDLHNTSFAKPEHRYDPFASPLLFFRTPAYELPTPSLYGTNFSPLANGGFPKPDNSSTELVPRRRSHRKHPPPGSGLVFPATRIEVGPRFPMRDQAIEFAELIQRSVDLYEETSETPHDRVELVERGEDEGLWEEQDVMEIGRWMGEILRRD
ncbi:MAG: hypothetical protein LQ349_008312 [Xanthoria aureola]|nr:MAG: hypothetical protein LQ349_008312 [Xanthoria aureola]